MQTPSSAGRRPIPERCAKGTCSSPCVAGPTAQISPPRPACAARLRVASRRLDVPTLLVDDPLQALQRLARWSLVRPDAPSPTVVGITGTVGKTTTKDALATILRYAGKRISATEGNLNNE